MNIGYFFGTLVRALPVAAVICLSLSAAHAQAPAGATAIVLSTDPAASSIGYHMVHKLHKFDALSKKVEGKVKLLPTGAAQIAMRAPVESFDSGNSNRDAHMKETVEAARYSSVDLKAIGEGITVPTTFPATVSKTFKGQLTFHGVTNTVDLPVTLTFESATKVKATVSFSVSLDAFKIERPSLLFIKVEDEMKLDVSLAFSR